MARPKQDRETLIEALMRAGRDSSTVAILFHEAIAARLGLSGADHKYAGLLMDHGPMTAGELAEMSGLTTGAITGVIDRLERAGWVRREDDPRDRRRVIVRPTADPAVMARAQEAFEPLVKGMRELTAGYTNAELAFILDLMRNATGLTRDLIGEVRSRPLPPTSRRPRTATRVRRT